MQKRTPEEEFLSMKIGEFAKDKKVERRIKIDSAIAILFVTVMLFIVIGIVDEAKSAPQCNTNAPAHAQKTTK